MKQVLFLSMLFYSIAAGAQEKTSNSTTTKPHKLELSYNSGYSFSNVVVGDVYAQRAYKWKIKDNVFHKINLGYYIGKRVEIGIGANTYKWNGHIEYLALQEQPNDATATVLSSYVFSNYYLPVSSGLLYGGVAIGYTKSFVSGVQLPIRPGFYSGHGYEYNAHLGYKFPLIENRLWFNVEAAGTQTKISRIDISWLHNSGKSYAIDGYAVLGGLMFRM